MIFSIRLFVLISLLTVAMPPVAALELFGVSLESTNRDELRGAAKKAGVVLIREGGEGQWFDIYNSAGVLPGSIYLYLGFVKQDQRFAFAEYEFQGIKSNQMLTNLTQKYGDAEVTGGRYISDSRYRWQLDGIDIQLVSDWQNYRTRLSYIVPSNMIDLVAEQAELLEKNVEEPNFSSY